MILGGLFASKVGFIVANLNYYVAKPNELISFWTLQSGGTYFGGMLGALLVLIGHSRLAKLPHMQSLDTSAVALPLGHAIGRLGCLAAGCCYGKPTSLRLYRVTD
jgi:phosphatidylglycerol---prolipoprotein diacylglyceryl transferase